MKGDFTRSTFKPKKHYSSVRMQQGRVQLDADWNEQIDIAAHRTEVEAVDVIGGCGAPMHNAGFSLSSGPIPKIGPGHYYVDGILCENDEEVDLDKQPDLPVAGLSDLITPTNATVQDGRYIAYLDIWQRQITALEDDKIREVALDGPDTATRTKTVWQVKLLGPLTGPLNCASEPQAWTDLLNQKDNGKLSAKAEESENADGPCVVLPGAGYRRLENQLYRVEIHAVAESGAITVLKWSRDNGSIVTRWIDQDPSKPEELIVSSIGRDDVLRFGPGQYVEVIDDQRELRGEAGILIKLANAEGQVLTLDTTDPNAATVNIDNFPDKDLEHPNNRKARRWDGVLPKPVTDTWLELEDGVQIKLEEKKYHVGDYWLIPARTITGDVEWLRDDKNDPIAQLRAGIEHHYCKLAILEHTAGGFTTTDCRQLFPPLTELTTLLYVGGDGQEAMPGHELLQKLQVRVVNGQTPVIDAQVLFMVTHGHGSLTVTKPVTTTAPNGAAECGWTLGTADAQEVEALLIDASGSPVPGQILRFSANLSVASQVAYDPAQCPVLAEAKISTVQGAIDVLCQNIGRGHEDGIYVEKVMLLSNQNDLHNDSFVPPGELVNGIRIECDNALFPDSIGNKHGFPNPVCTVTLELPWPLLGNEREFWNVTANSIIGYQPITLEAAVDVAGKTISWVPSAPAQAWLKERLLQMITQVTKQPRVLARLKLRGNFIWGPGENPDLYLDGEVYGVWGGDHVDVSLKSGNGKRGGDFEMWFWLGAPQALRQVILLGNPVANVFNPLLATRRSGLADSVKLALNRAMLRGVVPPEFEVNASLAQNSSTAQTLVRKHKLQGIQFTVWSETSLFNANQRIAEMVRPLEISMAPQLVDDLMNKLQLAVAASAAPEAVLVDTVFVDQLRQLGYTYEIVKL